MRTVPLGGAAQIERLCNSTWIRVRVEDHLGAMQSVTPFSVEYEEPSADAPIGAATVVFRRGEGVSSLAPLMSVNPPIDVGRALTIEIDAGDGSWTPVFSGRIDLWSSPARYGDVTVEARDLGGVIVDTFIQTERAYGSEAGTALETVIQQVGDDNLEDPPTVYVPTPTSAVVVTPPDYVPSDIGTYDAQRGLAETIGWALRFRHIDSLSAWRYTLFQPSRTKVLPDHTFAGADYYEVTALDRAIEDIYNVVEVEYSDGDGVRQRVQYPAAGDVAADPSVVKYGIRYMRINEASDSPIRDATSALALATAAYSDLSEPDATLEIQCAYFWPGEVGVDLYSFTANNKHFTSDQELAPVAIRHRLAVGERPQSWVRVRGKPSAGKLLWRKKAKQARPVEPDSVLQISNVVWTEGATTGTLDWDVGAKITQSWIGSAIVDSPATVAKWDAVAASVLPVGASEPPVTLTMPVESSGTAQLLLVQIEARYTDPATGDLVVGDIERVIIHPKVSIPAIDDDTGDLADGSVKLAKQFAASMGVVKWVDTAASLPADDTLADYYVAADTGQGYEWNGSAWVAWDPASNLTSQTGFFPALLAGVVKAVHITADSLAAISAVLGTVYTGLINNLETNPTRGIRLDSGNAKPGTWTDYIDLAATGTDPVISIAGFTALADGTTLVEDSQTKTIRYSHHGFRPFASTNTYSSALNNTTSLDALSDFGCPIAIPVGATITRLQFRGAKGDAANTCECSLYRQEDDGSNAVLATSTITSTTAQDIGDFLGGEVVAEGFAYLLLVTMTRSTGTGPSFEWAEIQYTSDNYRQTL